MALLDAGTLLPLIWLRDENGAKAALPRGETLYALFKTTCPTCAFAWPYLDRIRSIAEGGALTVLAISQDDRTATDAFNTRLGVKVKTLYDPEPWAASAALGITTVPTFVSVDAGGEIRDAAAGFQRHKMEEFAARAARASGRTVAPLFSPDEDIPAIKPG